jgi:CubicO group peptidase (beta-lactamase class C family)
MIRLSAVIILFGFVWCSSSAQPNRIIEKFMKESKVPGMFVAVVRGDSVLYEKSFGVADIESSAPVSNETCFELGSISKALTAEVIYDLHREGLLNITDPIHPYFPEAPGAWSKVQIQHLLRHTSGIENYLLDPRFMAAQYFTNAKQSAAEHFFTTVSTDSMVQLFYSLPLEFSPGFTWSYSNTGYYLLGKIGEAVTGKPFFQLVKERVTSPLHMSHTKANEQAANEGCLAKGYFSKDSALAESRVLSSNYAFSAGAWATTGQDMVSYLKAIHQRRLPSDKAGFEWRKPPDSGNLPFTYDGGHFYTTFQRLNIVSHNGGTPGFSSSWIYVVDKNLSIIVLMNRQDYAAIDQLAWDVLSTFDSALKYPEKILLSPKEKHFAKRVQRVLNALETNTATPAGLSRPLQYFLGSENGKGYWKWYFERGFPKTVYCVGKEIVGNAVLYRFQLLLSKEIEYRLSVLVNNKVEFTQIRWW